MIAERCDSKTPSAPSTFARLKSITCLTEQDEDMFGNVFLHHAFASSSPDIILIQKSLKDAPNGAQIKNQFGRIPLHYALDRTKVNMECFYLLLKVCWIPVLSFILKQKLRQTYNLNCFVIMQIYPQGAVQVDDQGSTPYDLSLRWNHSNSILKVRKKFINASSSLTVLLSKFYLIHCTQSTIDTSLIVLAILHTLVSALHAIFCEGATWHRPNSGQASVHEA